MAITPNQYLKSDPLITLKDYQHGARLFVDDKFRLSPKAKFLFHVSFSINQAALKTIDLAQRYKNEINMLVKSAELPSFSIKTQTLNQYNRKKVVQYIHEPKPITIKFHDDNMGLITNLWQNYYSYYYADSTSAQSNDAYSRNATKSFDFVKNPYGFDNRSTTPFFNYITIYQMARHEFVSYKLINPVIQSWSQGSGDYSVNGPNETSMTLGFEAVAYGKGGVTAGDPEGFGLEHYDTVPSPLTSNGILPSASPSFTQTTVSNNSAEFVKNLTTTINTYQNTQPLANAGTPGILTGLIKPAATGVSGLQGITFPISPATSTTVTAKKVNLG